MEKSFNRYSWNPIRHGYYPQPQIKTHPIKPKVINIPVQFVSTDNRTSRLSPATPPAVALSEPSEEDRVSAAAMIQRAVRGFLVRKNARFVRQIAAEVDEIERKLKKDEAKIRLDDREQLRVNEALMALLLRLDSVRGVRDFRKKVIRRVISLQETIDSISAAADGIISAIGVVEDRKDSCNEAADQSSINNEKETEGAEVELEMEIPAAVESPNRKSDRIAAGDGMISAIGIADDVKNSMGEAAEESLIDIEKAADETLDPEEDTSREIPAAIESANRKSDLIATGDDAIPAIGIADDLKDSTGDAAGESSMDHEDQALDLEEETNEAAMEMETTIQEVDNSLERASNAFGCEIGRNGLRSPDAEEIAKCEDFVASQRSSLMVAEKEEEEIGMRKLMENMAAENERLREMLAQLCATSAEQCRLMNGLTDRVEHLERVVHRMDRRRKRRGAACSAISSAK